MHGKALLHRSIRLPQPSMRFYALLIKKGVSSSLHVTIVRTHPPGRRGCFAAREPH